MGPYNLSECHWLAVMISMNAEKFIILDPKGNGNFKSNFRFHYKCYDSWKNCYNKCHDKKIENWNHDFNLQHPIQPVNDNHNCGVFVCLFINHFVNNNENIKFDSTKKDMKNYRSSIAKILEDNKK